MQFATIVALFAASVIAAPAPEAPAVARAAAAAAAAAPQVEHLAKRCNWLDCALALGPLAATCLLSEEAVEIPCVVGILATVSNPPAACQGC